MEAAVLEHKHERVDVRARASKQAAKSARPISPAERRILNLAVKGFTDKEICRELDLSITTVRTHWTRLRRKLGVVNRAQAIAESMELESNAQLKLLQSRVRAMHRALNQKGLGVWEWHPQSDLVIADELSQRMFSAVCPGEPMPLMDYLRCLPHEDRTLLAEHLKDGKTPSAEGICHRVRLTNRQVQLRTKMTRVLNDDHVIMVCTTESLL
ncbi:MAG: response regulator transcription factor [Fimbriimonas sp.]